MERFHFCFAGDFLQPFPHYVFSHKPLDAAAGQFVRNLLRIQSLGRIPILLTGAAIVAQTYETLARVQLGIPNEDSQLMMGHPGFNDELYEKKEQLRMQMQGEWFKRTQEGKTAGGMTVGEIALGLMVPAGGDETREGIDAILSGMITGLWTALEVLFEDVWNAAVAARSSLEAGITDKEWKQCGLRSTKKIRSLYGYTFRTDATGIDAALYDDRVDALALTRNILVHTGGVIDKDFDDRRAGIAALACFLNVARGQKIPLTGPVVHHLLTPISLIGLALVKAVDLWLESHP